MTGCLVVIARNEAITSKFGCCLCKSSRFYGVCVRGRSELPCNADDPTALKKGATSTYD